MPKKSHLTAVPQVSQATSCLHPKVKSVRVQLALPLQIVKMESEIGTFLPEVRQRCFETRSGRSNLPQLQPALTMGPKIMRIRVYLVSLETL